MRELTVPSASSTVVWNRNFLLASGLGDWRCWSSKSPQQGYE